ncbi:MAG: phosphoribosylaminoimidazolesuccinocarboxamide synthase [Bacteroidetes bacterium]|nr:phosphoribosylaminoimidazolesuccinocarboxamide synthase [Bacteroidota bacterium]
MQLPNQTAFYKGKVRDVYTIADKYMVMLVSDRISAFDVVLPKPIPYKGQVLNQIAAQFLDSTKDIVPNWMINVPLPNVTIGYKCETYPVEMVVRGNLTGHAWRTYKSGRRELCGVTMPDGMKENDFFESPILTPTTKAHVGHDEDISRDEIISSGLVSKEEYEQLEKYTIALFERGREMAKERGLILVDTKYEFGKIGDTIYLIDEIHTPDSSRYFYLDGYEERQKKGEPQKQLSKEFVREWLMENGFQGQEGQQVPEMTEEVIARISERYIELFEVVTGKTFVKQETSQEQTEQVLKAEIAKLLA